jgi:IS30 family transposase
MTQTKYKDKIKKLQEDKDKQIIALRDKNISLEEIGERLGYCKETIRKRLLKLGYEKKKKVHQVDK